eukprot:2233637-Pyramimonas_sp.AAC.1
MSAGPAALCLAISRSRAPTLAASSSSSAHAPPQVGSVGPSGAHRVTSRWRQPRRLERSQVGPPP